MKIYVAHSRDFDYLNELYKPIREDEFFNQFDIVLPHEKERPNNTRDYYKSIDLFIAECSYMATGLGIELGFAYDDGTPIYCLHRFDKKISGSIYAVTNNIYEYHDKDEMVKILKRIIEKSNK